MNYFSAHPACNAIAHAAAGFGLAVLLQHYLVGMTFVNFWVGWALVGLGVVMHVRSFMQK